LHADAAIHSVRYINAVTIIEILAAIDAEIGRLQQVRNLIARRGEAAGSAATQAKRQKGECRQQLPGRRWRQHRESAGLLREIRSYEADKESERKEAGTKVTATRLPPKQQRA
jgi:hypothetical protein